MSLDCSVDLSFCRAGKLCQCTMLIVLDSWAKNAESGLRTLCKKIFEGDIGIKSKMNCIFIQLFKDKWEWFSRIALSRACFVDFIIEAGNQDLSQSFCKEILSKNAYVGFERVAIYAKFPAKDRNLDSCYSGTSFSKYFLDIVGKVLRVSIFGYIW